MNVDLHVHSALSACAENLLSPMQILRRAQERSVQVLAITDHNASTHVQVATKLAPQFDLVIIPGMELTTREEVHVLVYFPDVMQLMDFQELVDKSLPKAPNLTDIFGYQVLYDESDEITDTDDRLRQTGISLGLEGVLEEVRQRQGFLVPAHIFKARFSLTSQLGFVDEAAGFDAVEITRQRWLHDNHKLGDRVHGFPVVSGSDAHFIEDIGSFYLTLPKAVSGIGDIMQALQQNN